MPPPPRPSLIETLHPAPPQPPDYPLSPFKMKFDPPLFHPNGKCSHIHSFNHPHSHRALALMNVRPSAFCFVPPPVYPDGNVCISILHNPGEDPLMYEQASERWSPVQSVEKVLLSVISMLAGTFSIFHPFSKRDKRALSPPAQSPLALIRQTANHPNRTEP
jgi:hypothetical protein